MTTQPTDEEMDRCERMLTDCTCHPDYQRLGMAAPDCMACQLGSEVIDTFRAMRAALQSIAKPVRVPDAKHESDYECDEGGYIDTYCQGHMDGWNDCREATLSTSSHQRQTVSDLSNLTDDQLREFVAIGFRHAEVSNFKIDDLRPAFKRLNAILSSSPQPQQAVPDGWMWFSADLSCLCAANNKNPRAIVGFVRDVNGQAWWHSLSEEEKEATGLYVYAEGKSFSEAFAIACDLIKKEVIAPHATGGAGDE